MKNQGAYLISMPGDETQTEAERREFWRDDYNAHRFKGEHLYPVDIPYRVRMVRQETGLYVLDTFRQWGPVESTRTECHVRQSPDNHYHLIALTGGSVLTVIGNTEVTIGPGMAVLGTANQPLRMQVRDAQGFAVRLPRPEVISRLGEEAPAWTAFDLRRGIGRISGTMLRALHEERDSFSAAGFDATCERLTELFCMLAVGDDRPAVENIPEIEPMVRRYVRQHIASRDMSLPSVAAGLGWSPRQLQSALRQVGTTYRELVRDERLTAARRCLANPAFQHRPIVDIALGCGFASGNVLSVLFKERYGESPREYRYRALGQLRP
ncbi:AraC family transcriptional regulator [Streptomyces sp. NPDC049887]|uniref:AraC family transcriptional regulator n=1 Tax=Streptomyces sp. NPDC049887 TaxID=3155654 RepID=UPI00343D068C